MKKIVMMIMMFLFIFCSKGIEVSAGVVDDKLHELQVMYPEGSFFTANGQSCSHSGTEACSNCKLATILQKRHPSFYGKMNGEAWTCCAFARFAFYYTFGHEVTTNVTTVSLADARPGDYIVFNNGRHYGIFISQGMVMDGNGSNRSVVGEVTHYNKYPFQENSNYTIYRSLSYDLINNTDTEPPTISNIRITDASSTGYTVNCDVTDNSGVARVCFPTWTVANGQDDLFGDWYNTTAVYAPSNGNTYSYRVNISDHNYETGEYTTHIYAYDIHGNHSNESGGERISIHVPLNSFTLSRNKINLFKEQTQTLTITAFEPTNTTVDRTADWKSLDSSIAVVDAMGNVTGKQAGTTYIVCTIAGKEQRCEVAVSDINESAFSSWTTSLPDEVANNQNLYEIQTKKQYRSQTKSETISTDANLGGWTKSGEYWGEWQACGADVTATATREVATDSTFVKKQYKYNHWHNYSNSRLSPVQYDGWIYEETGWLDNPLTPSGTSNAGGTKYASGSGLGPCGFSKHWYNELTQDVYNTTYRYRDKMFQYYQWSAWSDWSDTFVNSADNVNVEERTMYRYYQLSSSSGSDPADNSGSSEPDSPNDSGSMLVPVENGWNTVSDKSYWYEGGIKQGTYSDPKGVLGDGTVRGREIYDPESDGWYWLDAVYSGAKAVNKEVWMPYIYQNEDEWDAAEIEMNALTSGDMAQQVINEIRNKSGKWVRYDANGKMYKGWYTVEGQDAEIYPEQAGNTYYYDPKTGLMAKGNVLIEGREYHFDEVTGVLQ